MNIASRGNSKCKGLETVFLKYSAIASNSLCLELGEGQSSRR